MYKSCTYPVTRTVGKGFACGGRTRRWGHFVNQTVLDRIGLDKKNRGASTRVIGLRDLGDPVIMTMPMMAIQRASRRFGGGGCRGGIGRENNMKLTSNLLSVRWSILLCFISVFSVLAGCQVSLSVNRVIPYDSSLALVRTTANGVLDLAVRQNYTVNLEVLSVDVVEARGFRPAVSYNYQSPLSRDPE